MPRGQCTANDWTTGSHGDVARAVDAPSRQVASASGAPRPDGAFSGSIAPASQRPPNVCALGDRDAGYDDVMAVVLVLIVVIAMVSTLGMTLLAFPPLWRSIRASLSQLPARRRRRAVITSGVTLVVIAASTATMIAEPFGRPTILVVFGAYTLAIIVTLGVQAAIDLRGGRRRRESARAHRH
jgi:uncharacterized protein YjeT (DUF2065 family)